MAARILSAKHRDLFGVETGFYRSNAGDRIESEFLIEDSIRFRSIDQNTLFVDVSTNEITMLSGGWHDQGFRSGQLIAISGSSISTFTTTVSYVSGNTIGVASVGSVPNGYYNSSTFLTITAQDYHKSVDVLVNFVQNGGATSTSSLIDGENTIIRITDLDTMSIGDVFSGVSVGNASGQFDTVSFIRLDSESSPYIRRYTLTVITYQGGVYLQNQFIGSPCMKLICQTKWQVEEGEPSGSFSVSYNEDADTGWFNEAYNTGVINSTMVDGVNSIDYANPTISSFKVDSSSLDRQIGAFYLPLDATYYKNNAVSQTSHSMQLQAYAPYSDGLKLSALNLNGAGYTIDISTSSVVGTETTYDIEFTPNPSFDDFIDGREEGDRRMIVYMKVGNVNLIVFDGQLTKQPVPAGELPNVQMSHIILHNNNTQDFVGAIPPGTSTHYTEDDVALVLKFRPLKNVVYDRFVSIIEAYNIGTGDRFTLEQLSFDFSNIQISADGRYLLNETVGINNNLPSNSQKKQATLTLYPSIDVGSQYGVKFYYPFISRWEYWLPQANADVAFYPGQNKDWQHYSADPDWQIRIRSYLESNDQAFEHLKIFNILDYDSGNFTSQIFLFRENGDPCLAIVDGEIMKIRGQHTAAITINPDTVWGLIKIEPFENQPAWWITTILGNGNDMLNPFSNLTIDVTGNVVTFECDFDTNKLNSLNGVSISSRAFGSDEVEDYWLTTDGDFFLVEGTTDKWIIQD